MSSTERTMTSSQAPPAEPRLRSAGSVRPHGDGGWWPRSADPAAPPAILAAIHEADA